MKKELRDVFFTDGACRKNYGSCAFVLDGGEEKSFFIGEATNNQAEYWGVIYALQEAKKMGLTKIQIISDSQLMIRQITGRWIIKNLFLKNLYNQVVGLSNKLDVEYLWKGRELKGIKRADYLAGKKLEEHLSLLGVL